MTETTIIIFVLSVICVLLSVVAVVNSLRNKYLTIKLDEQQEDTLAATITLQQALGVSELKAHDCMVIIKNRDEQIKEFEVQVMNLTAVPARLKSNIDRYQKTIEGIKEFVSNKVWQHNGSKFVKVDSEGFNIKLDEFFLRKTTKLRL